MRLFEHHTHTEGISQCQRLSGRKRRQMQRKEVVRQRGQRLVESLLEAQDQYPRRGIRGEEFVEGGEILFAEGGSIAPGDFATVVRQQRWASDSLTPERLLAGLEEEAAFRRDGRSRGIGFTANV